MSFDSRRKRVKPNLDLEKLEERNLLSGLSLVQSCNVSEGNVFHSWSTEDPGILTATKFESVNSQSGFFGLRRPYIQVPTTVDLGLLDDVEKVEGSNHFFDRVDRYEFEVDQSGKLDANLEFDSKTRSGLFIFDQRRKLVAWAMTGRDSHAVLSTNLESGNHVAIVYRGIGEYRLSLDFQSDTSTQPPEHRPIEPGNQDSEPLEQVIDNPIDTPDAPSPPTSAPTQLPDVPYYGGQYDWNLNSVSAPEAWNAGYSGEGIVVAVIDTGVDVFHSDLNDNVWTNSDEIAGDGIDNDRNGFVDDYYGWNFVANSASVQDDNGHGTHVAGTIAAEKNNFGATGVAPDAEIMSVKVLNAQGSGYVNAIANGIRYAVNNGANIINLSLGGGYSSAIASALGYAASKDVLVVAAAGNEAASVPGYPAALGSQYSNTLSVGAYDNRGSIAGFSNSVGNSNAVQVDAPGVNIYSTASGGGYRFLSGTSMAAPHVAGVAALTLSANPNLTAASLRNVIVSSSNRTANGSDARGVVNSSTAIPTAINGTASSLEFTQNKTHSGSAPSVLSPMSFSENGVDFITGTITEYEVSPEYFDDLIRQMDSQLKPLHPLKIVDSGDTAFADQSELFDSIDVRDLEHNRATDLAIGEFDLLSELDLINTGAD